MSTTSPRLASSRSWPNSFDLRLSVPASRLSPPPSRPASRETQSPSRTRWRATRPLTLWPTPAARVRATTPTRRSLRQWQIRRSIERCMRRRACSVVQVLLPRLSTRLHLAGRCMQTRFSIGRCRRHRPHRRHSPRPRPHPSCRPLRLRRRRRRRRRHPQFERQSDRPALASYCTANAFHISLATVTRRRVRLCDPISSRSPPITLLYCPAPLRDDLRRPCSIASRTHAYGADYLTSGKGRTMRRRSNGKMAEGPPGPSNLAPGGSSVRRCSVPTVVANRRLPLRGLLLRATCRSMPAGKGVELRMLLDGGSGSGRMPRVVRLLRLQRLDEGG